MPTHCRPSARCRRIERGVGARRRWGEGEERLDRARSAPLEQARRQAVQAHGDGEGDAHGIEVAGAFSQRHDLARHCVHRDHRGHGDQLAATIVRHVLEHRGVDEGGMDVTDPDPGPRPQLDPERLGEAAIAELARGIAGSQGRGSPAGHGHHVDQDALALLQEWGHGGMRPVDVADQVGADDLVVSLSRRLGEAAESSDPGVVHPHVEPSERFHRLGGDPRGGLGVLHVGLHRDRPSPLGQAFVDHRLQAGEIARGQHQAHAAPGELQGRGPTDPTRGAGDHHNSPLVQNALHPVNSCATRFPWPAGASRAFNPMATDAGPGPAPCIRAISPVWAWRMA